jgi:hypothetical protein
VRDVQYVPSEMLEDESSSAPFSCPLVDRWWDEPGACPPETTLFRGRAARVGNREVFFRGYRIACNFSDGTPHGRVTELDLANHERVIFDGEFHAGRVVRVDCPPLGTITLLGSPEKNGVKERRAGEHP